MALSAGYVDIVRIPLTGGDHNDSQTFSNISATTATFKLRGGKYGLSVKATYGGQTVTLSKLMGDGSTWVAAMTAVSADGYSTGDFAEGDYRITVA